MIVLLWGEAIERGKQTVRKQNVRKKARKTKETGKGSMEYEGKAESCLGRRERMRKRNSERVRNSLVDSHSSVIITGNRTPSTIHQIKNSSVTTVINTQFPSCPFYAQVNFGSCQIFVPLPLPKAVNLFFISLFSFHLKVMRFLVLYCHKARKEQTDVQGKE